MNIIGIDPGADGALAVISGSRNKVEVQRFKNKTEKDIYSMLARYILFGAYKVYIEKVGGFPGQGAPRAFNFGMGYGFLKGSITALGVPFELVTPQNWQKELSLGGKFKSKPDRKRAHKQKAEQLFPCVDINLANADALLVAEYGHRKENLFR